MSLGPLVYVDLLATDILLDYLGILEDLFTDADLLLDDRSLLDHDLFLDHGHHYLVFFPDLRFSGPLLGGDGLPLNRDVLHGDLHALLGNHDLLVIGYDALAHPHGPDLAFAGSDLEFLLDAPHPELIFI